MRYGTELKMSRGFLKFTWPTLLVGALFVAAPLAYGPESPPKRGQAILFSDPKSGVMASNAMQSATEKPALKNLPGDSKKSFEAFNSEDSLSGALMPMAQPAPPPMISSKRVKALIEKRKDWVFLSPEEIVGVQSAEDALQASEYDADGKEKGKAKPVQRYRERLDKSRAAMTNQVQSDGIFSMDSLPDGRTTSASGNFPRCRPEQYGASGEETF